MLFKIITTKSENVTGERIFHFNYFFRDQEKINIVKTMSLLSILFTKFHLLLHGEVFQKDLVFMVQR